MSIQQYIINHFSSLYVIVNSIYINLNLYKMNCKSKTKSININIIKNISIVNSKFLKFREIKSKFIENILLHKMDIS